MKVNRRKYSYDDILNYLFDKKYEVSQKWFVTFDTKLMDEWDMLNVLIDTIQSLDNEDDEDDDEL